jgi:PhzF family phenazine biosynthesis protein
MKIYQVDAFTDQPFRGNPACVCMLDGSRSDAWMQSLAHEMNLSETAFPLRREHGFDLRWFTPKSEVGLCGHATLATAHILWEEQYVRPEEAVPFSTKSGLLTARRDGEWIELDFPARTVADADGNPALNRVLGITPRYTSKSSSPRGDLYLLEVESEEVVRAIAPDFAAVAASGARSVIVTACSATAGYDFVSRFFAPAIGINEDPVTGSAHCYLAPYWGAKLGKKTLVGLQVSARTGIVGCNWNGDRVILRGKAVTVFRGELLV